MLSNRQRYWVWLLISFGLGLSLISGYYVSRLNNAALSIFLAVIALILFLQIFRKPFLGLAFMLASLPLLMYTRLPGNLNFTSITSFFGLVALVAFVLRTKGFWKPTGVYDKTILISTVLLLLLITIEEISKPVVTEVFFPFTYLQLLILIWLTAQLFTSQREIETLMKLFIWGNFLGLLIALPDFDYYSSPTAIYVTRLAGGVGNANEFSIYISVAVLMLMYFSAGTENKLKKSLLLILGIAMILPIVLSGSRGSILFGFPVVIWQLWRFDKKNISTILLLFAGLLFISNFIPVEYISRIKDIPQDILNQSDTVGLRFGLWKYAIELWRQKPIWGIGTGVFVYLSNQSPVLHGIKNLQAHNTYITYLAENGIFGLALFLIIIFRSIKNFERVIKQKVHLGSLRNLAITWEATMLIFLLNGIKGNLNMNKVLWFSFAISTVLLALTNQHEKSDDAIDGQEFARLPSSLKNNVH